MVFSSIPFLFVFLPVVLLAYYGGPRRLRNLVLALASLVFYVWGSGALVSLLLISALANYFAGGLVARARKDGRVGLMKLGVGVSVAANVALLGFFKYANFVVAQLNALGEHLGLGQIAWESVTLPIGISFYTFQAMSYAVDVYRGRVEHLKNPVNFILFVALFPQLIVGPIVRFHEISDQILERETGFDRFCSGVMRFCHGLVKKVVIADTVAVLANSAFALPADRLNGLAAWLGIVAFTVQLYFDFSAYSDMAVGLGRMFGFTFPENFNRPYSAISVTDFWRRWHMTLGAWFKDYLFIPMGGSQGGPARTYFNLWTVFFVCGLWHGAEWRFLVFGCYFGVVLVLERALGQRPLKAAEARFLPLRRLVTILLVMNSFVLFRADSLTHAWYFFQSMYSFPAVPYPVLLAELGSKHAFCMFLLSCAVFFLPQTWVGGLSIDRGKGLGPALLRVAVVLLGTFYATVLVIGGSFAPFLYFQF